MKARNLIILLAIGLASFTSSSAASIENVIIAKSTISIGIRPSHGPRIVVLGKKCNDRKHIKRNSQKARRIIVVRRGR
jgi:hypothetical protein